MVKQLIPTEGLCFILLHCWENAQSPSYFKETYNLRPDVISPMISKLKELKFLIEDVNHLKTDNRKRYYKTNKKQILATIRKILKLSEEDIIDLRALINKLESAQNIKNKLHNYIKEMDFTLQLDTFMQVPLYSVFLFFLITQEDHKIENEDENEDQDEPYIDYVIRYTKNLFEQNINEKYFLEEVIKVNESEDDIEEGLNYQLISRIYTAHMFYRLFPDINPFEILN